MTAQQKQFCENYLANGYNAVQAYFDAYPSASKDNPKPSYPYRLLKNEEIKAYLDERRKEIYDSLNIDAERIAQELSEMAFAVKGDEVYSANIKLKALELLQKQFGLQNQKIESKQEIIEISLED